MKSGDALVVAGLRWPPKFAAEIEEIRCADVFVLIYPIWFGTLPAMLKGYVDRVFGAGFDHRAMREHKRHSFMADKALLSLSSSGNSLQWLEGQGAWLTLLNVSTYVSPRHFRWRRLTHSFFEYRRGNDGA